jgi:TRAP-type mannitol/chloroaromatic compound transport system permease small subunit
MRTESGALVRVIRGIDTVSDWSGRIVAWLVIPLVAVMAWEIVVRNVARPTYWAFDLSYMLYGALFMLGSAYTLYRGSHIRTDFLYQKWPVRVQAAVDGFCYLFLFFPGIAIFLWLSTDWAILSWTRQERAVSSSWMPPLYPLKSALPVALALLLLQGVSEFLKCVYAARHAEWLSTPRSIEAVLADEMPLEDPLALENRPVK